MLPAASVTPQRREYLVFTEPYLDYPVVLLCRDTEQQPKKLEELVTEPVGVTSGYAENDFLVLMYPEAVLRTFSSTEEGLEALSVGEIDYFAANIASVSAIIDDAGLSNLKIIEHTEFYHWLCIAVRSDWPQLVPILQKALDAIPEHRKTEIYRKWIHIENPSSFLQRYRYHIIVIILFIVLITSAILLWNRSLAVQVKQKLEENAEQQEALTESNRTKEFLLQEVNHRVNNNLQTILSLLELGRRSGAIGNTEETLFRLESRVSTLATAHELLTGASVATDVNLALFTSDILSGADNLLDFSVLQPFSTGCPDISIPAESAVSYSLLINELYVNSLLKLTEKGESDLKMIPECEVSAGRISITFDFLTAVLREEDALNSSTELSVDLINGMLAVFKCRTGFSNR